MQLLNELNLSTFEQFTTGSKLMQLGDSECVVKYITEIPALPLLSLIDLHLFMRKVANALLTVYVTQSLTLSW